MQGSSACSHVTLRLRCWERERCRRQQQPLHVPLWWRLELQLLLLLLLEACPLQWLRQLMVYAAL